MSVTPSRALWRNAQAKQTAIAIPLPRDEAERRRATGDALILRNRLVQAGFNSHDAAAQLDALADLLDAEFPLVDDEPSE